MKITLETDFGIHTIELHKNVIAIDAVIGGLVVPVLRAAGYFEENIRDYIKVDECNDAFVYNT